MLCFGVCCSVKYASFDMFSVEREVALALAQWGRLCHGMLSYTLLFLLLQFLQLRQCSKLLEEAIERLCSAGSAKLVTERGDK